MTIDDLGTLPIANCRLPIALFEPQFAIAPERATTTGLQMHAKAGTTRQSAIGNWQSAMI
jgi:hypothetical protein